MNSQPGCLFPCGRTDIVRRKYRYQTGNIHESLHIDENMQINNIVFHQLYHLQLVWCASYTLECQSMFKSCHNWIFCHRKFFHIIAHLQEAYKVIKKSRAASTSIWAILTNYNIYMLLCVFKGVFGDALISRRFKLHSWNFRFRKLRILGAYDLKGSKLHMV